MNSKNDIKKVSIVMSYFNRKDQLKITLESIRQSSYKNIEIIIVDDNSDIDERVDTFINDVKDNLDIKVITINEKEKTWVNPCMPYNIGFKKATGDIIIIQNPEVMHVGDCIKFVVDNIKINNWISFNCYGSPNFEVNNYLNNISNLEKFNFINNIMYKSNNKDNIGGSLIGGNSVKRDNVGGWLNHHNIHFVAYHYCSAIYRTDLFDKLNGGFNEDFKYGLGADDDEFIKRLIYNKFNFKINEFKCNSPFTIHQFHKKSKKIINYNYQNNKKIFDDCCLNMNFTPENDIALAPENETPLSRQIII